MGWDAAREQILANQKKLGIVPENTKLTEPHPEIPAWDARLNEEKKLYARQMEVFAAQLEHCRCRRSAAWSTRSSGSRARQHVDLRDLRQRRER